MRYHDPHKKNGTITTRVVCAVVFSLFSFAWLYWFQADVLTVAQHVLSGGITHYSRTVGAVLITLVLLLLQVVVAAIVQLKKRSHALTYLPSMLVLAVISDVSPDIDRHFSFGAWWWGVPLVLVIWGAAVWLSKQLLPFDQEKEPTGLFSRRVWLNMLQMAVMMLFVALVGNSNAVFHYRTHVEVALMQGDVDEALRVGASSGETDVNLIMLRAYALSLKQQMGERLFEYPVVGNSGDLLPFPDSRARTMLLPADSIYKHCGAQPVAVKSADRYLALLERDSLATDAVADYRLCGMLIDKKLDDFVHALEHYYVVNDSLPKHYKEALTLYTHLRSKPVLVFHSAVMDEDWADLQRLEQAYPDRTERKGVVADRYEGSYWYYYFYE